MYIGVDLGSTNIKAAIYDKSFNLVAGSAFFKSTDKPNFVKSIES